MNPRTGRPPIEDPRQQRIITRMSADELERLDYCCRVTGKARSEIIREGVDRIYQDIKTKSL